MKFDYILNTLRLLSLTLPFVNGKAIDLKEDECDDIIKYLGNFNTYNDFLLFNEKEKICKVNDSGKVDYLDGSTEEQIEKLLSYDTITNLEYNVYYWDIYDYEEKPGKYLGISPSILKLQNLEYLNINHYATTNECSTSCPRYYLKKIEKGFLNNLNKLKTLKLHGVRISQDNINEISQSKNLEELSFENCYLEDSIDYKPLKNLDKLSKMTIVESILGFASFEYNTSFESINNLLNNIDGPLKELSLRSSNLSEIDIPSSIEKLCASFNGINSSNEDSIDLRKSHKLKNIEFRYNPLMLSIYSHLSARLEFKLPTSNNIETLKLSGVELSDEQMKEISFSSNLKELNCINTVLYDISNNTEQSINQLKNLQSL
ncbi:hypothetical protein BCR36DRAFT_105287 [Piromyces finnis]|uniref:RNI-like protein n=1 Tax=Piromyces finnis TaxID=1754191 RepID=A0A1Y1V4C7_9FUNG|nr:hypothetical protein BCR36DRAFT_105287 [Piromyces finnis]|eukprot:ORX46208.1 hypothetical protein BCR36DRAFT_105287 [Piromyces finnis]